MLLLLLMMSLVIEGRFSCEAIIIVVSVVVIIRQPS